MLWCVRKCLQSATMLSYSSWGKKGIFTPIAQWLSCICWIEYWKKKSVISTVTADQLYAVVIQTVDVKLSPIRRKLERNRSVNVSSSHLFSGRYVNFLSGHSRIWWASGFNSHLWKRAKLFTACFLGSDVQNYFPLNRWIWSPFLFWYLVLGCSYQNLCWSCGVLFFSSLLKLYRTPTCKTWFSQEDFNGLWCERLLKYFLWSQIFCWFFLWAKVILYSVLVYRKHQYFKTSFVEKLSRKSLAVCEALL